MKSVYSAVRIGSLNKAVCASSLKDLIQIGLSLTNAYFTQTIILRTTPKQSIVSERPICYVSSSQYIDKSKSHYVPQVSLQVPASNVA
jgi:hypothetical protein